MRRLALVLALLAGPVWATQDQWPALHDVTGVAADDVLNIRAAPSAAADIVGTLAPDATGIEVIRPDDRHGWGLVNTGEGTGWVSLSYLRMQPGQWLGNTPQIKSCAGTEPFWSLSVDATGAVRYETPDADQGGAVIQTVASENRRDRHALAMRFDGGRWGDAVGVMRLERCGDGMSDREYGIAIDLLLGAATEERMVSGCCSLSE